MIRECPCGAEFTPTHGNQKHCPTCREPRITLKVCGECGHEFTPSGRGPVRYCPSCRELRQIRQNAAWLDHDEPRFVGDEQSAYWVLSLQAVLDREREDGEDAVARALRDGVTNPLRHTEHPFSPEILDLELHADARHAHCTLQAVAGHERTHCWPARSLRQNGRPRKAQPPSPAFVRPHELFRSVELRLRVPNPAAEEALEERALVAIGVAKFVGYDDHAAFFRTDEDELVRVLRSTPWVREILGTGYASVVAELTAEQTAEVERLTNEGVPKDQALAIVTERQLDVVIDGSGPLEPLPPLTR